MLAVFEDALKKGTDVILLLSDARMILYICYYFQQKVVQLTNTKKDDIKAIPSTLKRRATPNSEAMYLEEDFNSKMTITEKKQRKEGKIANYIEKGKNREWNIEQWTKKIRQQHGGKI